MKKEIILIMALCLFALSTAEAQVNKGRILLGVSTSFGYFYYGSDLMSLGFTTIKEKTGSTDITSYSDKITTFNFLPKLGYLVINNLAIGLDGCISSVSQKFTPDERSGITTIGLGPFVRYYIPGKRVMPFFEINSEFGSIIQKNVSQNYSYKSSTSMSSIGVGAGIAVKLGEKVTFDMMAAYNSVTEKMKENNTYNDKTVQGTLGFKFGFVILLGSGK